MKYKPGDKLIITIGRGLNGTREICYLVNNSFYLREDTLDALEPYEDRKQEAYQRGLNDAWEAARKIVNFFPRDNGLAELSSVFDGGNDETGGYTVRTPYYVINNYTAEEAIAKLSAYEEAREIHVGDEVKTVCEKFVVTLIGNDSYFGVEKGGALISANKNYCKKTGRHFPEVAALLEKMKDNADV